MSPLAELILAATRAVIDLVGKALEGDINAEKRVADILPPGSKLRAELAREAARARAVAKLGPTIP